MKGLGMNGANPAALRQLAAWREERKKPQFMEGSGFYGILHAVMVPAESAAVPEKTGGQATAPDLRPQAPNSPAAGRPGRCQPPPGTAPATGTEADAGALEAAERVLGQLAATLLAVPAGASTSPESTPVAQASRIDLQGWLRALGAGLDGMQRRGGGESELSLLFDSPGLGQVGVQVQFRGTIVEIGFRCGEQAAERIRRSLSVLTGRLDVLGWKVGRVQLLGARELVIRFVPVTGAASPRGGAIAGGSETIEEIERRRNK